jgi:hypothetical protein
MAKLGIITSLFVIFAALTFANVSRLEADTNPPCVMKEPKTEMVKKACAKGGQKAVKDAMKAFNAYFTDREHRNRRIVNTKTGRW